MRVGIDLDGCVYDFTSSLRYYISKTTGRPESEMGPPTTWNFFTDDWGYTLEEYLKFCAEGVDAEVIFKYGPPMPDAVQTLRKLRSKGHTLHIITDRSFGHRSQENTREWLQNWGVPYDTLTFSKDKTVVPTDAFIDDRPKNIIELRDVGCKAYLYALNIRQDQQEFIQKYGKDMVIYFWREFEDAVDSLSLAQV